MKDGSKLFKPVQIDDLSSPHSQRGGCTLRKMKYERATDQIEFKFLAKVYEQISKLVFNNVHLISVWICDSET